MHDHHIALKKARYLSLKVTLMRTKHEEAATPPLPTPEQVLLTEIRDLLREEVHGTGERQA